jgi:hypothetical protein
MKTEGKQAEEAEPAGARTQTGGVAVGAVILCSLCCDTTWNNTYLVESAYFFEIGNKCVSVQLKMSMLSRKNTTSPAGTGTGFSLGRKAFVYDVFFA